jgi:GT2 family glycosyltransferase/2-polyprenyl-3-methyl-5-hydroxy-6-metoxy-1,4-benzoquinol methylase
VVTLASDLSVVVPTRGRRDILQRTLDGLAAQSVSGFETVVVVDGADQESPEGIQADRVIVKEHAGPGVARNRGVAETRRPLLLFLGDDMVPTRTLVERHLERHKAEPDDHVAVLGHVEWHPEVPRGRIVRWLDWSASQFDYEALNGAAPDADVGWGRFYSCNVSLKRSLFLRTGGFDPDFTFDYEDLDLAFRLGRQGLVLRYEPRALVHHLHHYDFERLARRYDSRARAERLMARKHDWFQPYFGSRIEAATAGQRVSPFWPFVVDRIPARAGRLRVLARERADRWWHRRLASSYRNAYEGEDDLEDLRAYLGEEYDHGRLTHHVLLMQAEEEAAPSEAAFYRSSKMYLYDLTVFAMSGTKNPYRDDLVALVPPGSTVLDYGCGIGADGLRLLDAGYRVGFADFDNPSTEFLRWRLAHRGLHAPVYDVDGEVPGGFDAAFSFDVIEHVDDPFDFVDRLERRARVVAINFLDARPNDTHLHKPLPVGRLLDHAAAGGLLRYRRYHGRSHLAIWRSPYTDPRATGVLTLSASALARHAGPTIGAVRRRIRTAWLP